MIEFLYHELPYHRAIKTQLNLAEMSFKQGKYAEAFNLYAAIVDDHRGFNEGKIKMAEACFALTPENEELYEVGVELLPDIKYSDYEIESIKRFVPHKYKEDFERLFKTVEKKMIIIIPGELIAFVTFPGVVLHEVAHRLLCDITGVPVYAISYFTPLSKTAGHVIHAPIKSVFCSFVIGVAPLIINSLACMLLTFPITAIYFLGTEFLHFSSPMLTLAYYFMAWIGYSMGFNAFPSNRDVADLTGLAHSKILKAFFGLLKAFVWLLNAEYISFIFRLVYMVILSLILPKLFLN